jgi:hypothetical protein
MFQRFPVFFLRNRPELLDLGIFCMIILV